MKKIGVLTSGGDSQGMNAAVRSVVLTAIANGMTVMGINRGYKGLMTGDIFEMSIHDVDDIIDKGGTAIYSARCLEFKDEIVIDCTGIEIVITEKKKAVNFQINEELTFNNNDKANFDEIKITVLADNTVKLSDNGNDEVIKPGEKKIINFGVRKGVKTCHAFGIEGIVVCGGDGSFRGACDLTRAGIPCTAIPSTIDNDLGCSEYTIGFDTSLNIIVDSIDKLRSTSLSHDRCAVVQVMGRNAGWLALESGIASGAACILLPDIQFDFDNYVINRLKKSLAMGKTSFNIVVSEGVFFDVPTNVNYNHVVSRGIDTAEKMARAIETATGIESRETILGQLQRGGIPTYLDRAVASEMGYKAVNLLNEGKANRVMVMKDHKIIDLDILTALSMKRPIDVKRHEMADIIGI